MNDSLPEPIKSKTIYSCLAKSGISFLSRIRETFGVPRKIPLSDDEAAICRRFREFRDVKGIPRTVFAKRTGIEHSTLVRIEHGLMPVRYSAYYSAHMQFKMNPLWLRTGKGVPEIAFKFDDSDYKWRITEDALFSMVYDNLLASEMFIKGMVSQQRFYSVMADMEVLADDAKAGRFLDVPPDTLAELLSACDLVRETFSEFGKTKAGKAAGAKFSLKEIHASVKPSEVKPQWPLLKQRLQKATAQPGRKTELAEFLEVKLASVSQWLTDKQSNAREPGAETALRMLHWVELQERK